jgi:N-acetylglutamate synthase-like GNAT family acetyltransferase
MVESKIKICRAKPEDMSYIEEKLKRYLLDSTDIHWQQFFVIKNNDKIVAFARIKDHGEYFEFASLGVDYYHRKKGYGKKMLLFLIKEAKRLNYSKPIYSVTHLSEFLGKFGFEEVDVYPDYLDYKKNYICKYPYKIKIMKFKK